MADTRRFQSSEEMANSVFGSAVPSVSERQRLEAEHARAQELPPPPPEPPKRPGWTPPGVVTSNTAGEFAFRDVRPPTEADLERMNRNTMREIVASIRHQRKGG
jgi:hypothetical protein